MFKNICNMLLSYAVYDPKMGKNCNFRQKIIIFFYWFEDGNCITIDILL